MSISVSKKEIKLDQGNNLLNSSRVLINVRVFMTGTLKREVADKGPDLFPYVDSITGSLTL